jgi:hypothetical protein
VTAAAARGRDWAVGAAALLSAVTTAHAAEGLDTLLGRLAPPPSAPHATVKVLGWVERVGDDRDELVITLLPEGKAKLVADPGVTVTPVARDGILWSGTRPTSRVEPGTDYFPAPPTLRLPFAGADGRPVEATVEYAYCVVDRQCLFGETRVSAATTPQG